MRTESETTEIVPHTILIRRESRDQDPVIGIVEYPGGPLKLYRIDLLRRARIVTELSSYNQTDIAQLQIDAAKES